MSEITYDEKEATAGAKTGRPGADEMKSGTPKETRAETHGKPWLVDRENIKESAATRVGDASVRRDAIANAAADLYAAGDLHWGGKGYEGFGAAGCFHLPLIAAAKAGLMSMAQAVRLGKSSNGRDDAVMSLLDVLNFVPWSKAPPEQRWGDPAARANKGDVAVFMGRNDDKDVTHVALFGSSSGDIWSLEPTRGAPSPDNPLRKSHVNTYIQEVTAEEIADGQYPAETADANALVCVICRFPF